MVMNQFRPVRNPHQPDVISPEDRGFAPAARGRLVGSTGSDGEARPLLTGGAPYTGDLVQRAPDREKKCIANDDTCSGWRKAGSEYCVGHSNSEALREPR